MKLASGSETEQLVVFTVGADEFGVAIQLVREIIKEERVVRVPKMPAHIKGVLNLRGIVIPIIDLGERLGVAVENVVDGNRKILIVEYEDTQVGYLVNEVSEVLSVPAGALEAPASSLNHIHDSVVTCICKLDDRLFPVLDMERLADSAEIEELDALSAGSQTGGGC